MTQETSSPPLDRRTSILEAAKTLFLENGYSTTTISQIGRASGATTGSIYHAFQGKAAIATEIWRQANAGQTDVLTTTKKSNKAIQNHVRTLIASAAADRPIFDFCLELESRAATDTDFTELAAILAERRAAQKAAYKKWAKASEVKPIGWSVAEALLNGPAIAFLKNGGAATEENAEVFAMSAWRSLKA